MYAQLLEDLRAAKKFIFIEFYIIDEGLMWNSILEILEQKVKEGVEVKLLYDDIGCMATLAGNYTKRLRKMGIDAHKFNKVIPRLTVAYNNRDHRKILVIDGQIGYTGGVNLADEYINHIERFGHWKDSAIRLDGRAVKALTRLFLMNWYINRGEIEDFDRYHIENKAVEGEGHLHSLWEWTKADLQVAGRKDGLSKYDQPSDGLRLYHDSLPDHRL